MAEEPLTPGWKIPDWVTVAEAARRLNMSPSWFKAWAKADGIEVVRRGQQPGVRWDSVQDAIARSRVLPGYMAGTDPEAYLPGVALMAKVRRQYGWTMTDLARTLGVTVARVSEWHRHGVPDRWLSHLERLAHDTPN